MGRKPLGDRALSPAERKRRWRLRHPTDSRKRRQVQVTRTDDFAERQAVVWEYDWLIEELGPFLNGHSPTTSSSSWGIALGSNKPLSLPGDGRLRCGLCSPSAGIGPAGLVLVQKCCAE